MGSNAVGGRTAAVNGVDAVGQWNIDSNRVNLAQYAASNTKGGTVSVEGNQDWSGSYEAKGGTPSVFPGESFSFIGSVNGTSGVAAAARVDSVAVRWDVEGGKEIAHTVRFSADGGLTFGAAAASDASTVVGPPSKGCIFTIDDVELDDVRSVTLTLTAANKPYVSSSTGGVTKRVQGPLSGNVAMSLYPPANMSSLPALNDYTTLKLYVNDTEYWSVKYCQVAESSGIKASRDGTPVEANLNFQWSAMDDEGNYGEIITPESATKWPEA